MKDNVQYVVTNSTWDDNFDQVCMSVLIMCQHMSEPGICWQLHLTLFGELKPNIINQKSFCFVGNIYMFMDFCLLTMRK